MPTLNRELKHTCTTPVKALPPHVESAIHQTYSRFDGRQARERLAQGEIDILESCRKAVGWKYLTSLATKYYPLYPERHCWKRALALCLRYRSRWYTETLSIRYLLKAVIQQVNESLERNFSGKLGDILNSTPNTTNSIRETILNSTSRFQSDEDFMEWNRKKYLSGRYAHMIRH